MKRKSFSLIMAVILMLVAIPIAATGVAFAQPPIEPPPTQVYILPPSQTVSPGQVFTVDIYVEPAVPIIAITANLSFDPALLTADDCEEGDLLKQNCPPPTTPPEPCTVFHSNIDNVAGNITPIWGFILVNGPTAVSSPGSFATITFTAGETTGTSPLDLLDVTVTNAQNQPIPPEDTAVTSGSVTIEEEEPSPEGGCFIATAAYGSYLDSHVETLRDFRDSYMVTNPVGSALVSTYYKLSPPVAEFIDDHPTLKPIVRAGLLPAVAMSTVTVNTTSAEKIAIVSALLLVSALAVVWVRRRTFLR